jgi:uncharacterized RDD family membrane protein YckC
MGENTVMSEESECPLCGKTKQLENSKCLYGHQVCTKCYYAFANRRQFAYVIDLLLLFLIIATAIYFKRDDELTTPVFWLSIVFLLIKDGFWGYSPGKAILKLRVINENNGESIGLWRSFKRNIPVIFLLIAYPIIALRFLALPFAVLLFIVLCFFKGRRVSDIWNRHGHRAGDGWSQSKVIWKNFSSHPIFLYKSSSNYIWTEAEKEEDAAKDLSKALKVEIKGNWDGAIMLYQKIILDHPSTQIAKDAAIALESLKKKQESLKGK